MPERKGTAFRNPEDLSLLEARIIEVLQDDIPLTKRPFARLAECIQITEEELLASINDLDERGYIRRFGATLRHYSLGYNGNAMVVWRVEPKRVEEAADTMIKYPQVSHCYSRSTAPDWPYNLYTMVHGRDRAESRRIAEEISREVGIEDFRLLFTRKELKKERMRYRVRRGSRQQ